MSNGKIIEKFSYFDVSKPNQTIFDRFNNCNKIFFNKFYYSSYISDCSFYSEKMVEISSKNRDIVRNRHRYYKFGDYAILSFIGYRIYHHIKKGYFKTNSRLLDIYIFLKLTIYLVSLFYLKFYIFKSSIDPFLFEYFSIKEYNVALVQEQKNLERITNLQSNK